MYTIPFLSHSWNKKITKLKNKLVVADVSEGRVDWRKFVMTIKIQSEISLWWWKCPNILTYQCQYSGYWYCMIIFQDIIFGGNLVKNHSIYIISYYCCIWINIYLKMKWLIKKKKAWIFKWTRLSSFHSLKSFLCFTGCYCFIVFCMLRTEFSEAWNKTEVSAAINLCQTFPLQ